MATPTLKRKIGLWGASLSGIGVIVGAGIYALLGEATALAGGSVWVSFLLAAGVAGLTAISYARLSHHIAKDAPEFQYVRFGLGFKAGFVAGWLAIWAQLMAGATVALGFGGYFHLLTGVSVVPASLGLIVILSLIVWFGIQESVLLVSFFTLVEVGGLLLVVILGFHHWGDQPLLETAKGTVGIWNAAALIFFAYIGFEQLGNLAEEMHSPKKDLPKAILIAFVVSTLLYILVSISAISLVGWETLATSKAPMADVVAGDLKHWSKLTLTLIALGATFNTVLLMLFSVSRSSYGMAQAGALPKPLGMLGTRQTPWVSNILVWLIVSGFVFMGNIARAAQMANFLVLLAFSLVNLSFFSVQVRDMKEKNLKFSFKKLLGLLQPIVALLACIYLALGTGWIPIGLGLIVVAMGWFLGSRREKKTTG
ncbi:MAG TPA: APC family permease [candidate division Zixibacteria bacterium]|nr:APC family permease [candidate division Zixibacteria bacterium]